MQRILLLAGLTLLAIAVVPAGGDGNYGYLKNILHHPLIKCRVKGGTCMNIDNCNTTVNIYKDLCKNYNYHDVCCIPRETICHKFSGFCTNSSDTCLQAGQLLNKYKYAFASLGGGHHHGKHGHYKKGTVLSWLSCNSTHRCCHSYKRYVKHSHHVSDHGGYGGDHGGNYGGYGGGYGSQYGYYK